jgi:hypothetical protein
MSIILCTNNYNFNAKNERKTSSCPITSACPITKPKVYVKIHWNICKNDQFYINFPNFFTMGQFSQKAPDGIFQNPFNYTMGGVP